jgi:putative hydrolase of the HAD superfamily
MLLTDFGALTFDCYGTLIDWESGMVEALGAASPHSRPFARDPSMSARRESGSACPLIVVARRFVRSMATDCRPKTNVRA